MGEIKRDVGVVLLGHGTTATPILEAARGIVVGDALDDVIAVDAGAGQTPELEAALCRVLRGADLGRGVLLIVDLFGASPCTCGLREGKDRAISLVSGLNLAMVLKLATLDRGSLGPDELAQACAESAQRSVTVRPSAGQG